MATLLDAAMAKYGGKSWTLRVLESPASGSKTEEMIEEPLDLSSFVSNVCREITGTQTVTILFDVQMSVPEFAPVNRLTDAALHNDIKSLPDPNALLVTYQMDVASVWWSATWQMKQCKS